MCVCAYVHVCVLYSDIYITFDDITVYLIIYTHIEREKKREGTIYNTQMLYIQLQSHIFAMGFFHLLHKC